MGAPKILTAYDCIEFAMRVMEGQGISANQQTMRWAVQNAYSHIGEEFHWAFLQKHGRVFLHATRSEGTAAYNHDTRLVTLTGATFPSWAESANIVLDGIVCQIEQVITETTATLDAMLNPGRSIAAGASYRIYPGYYALPSDFKRMASPNVESDDCILSEVGYEELMLMERQHGESGMPMYYCVRGVEDLYGQMGLFIYPASDSERTLDFIYERTPRELQRTGWDAGDFAGSISTTAGSDTISGTGTSWHPSMEGAIIRIGESDTAPPTSRLGGVPWVEERSILKVESPTSIIVDAPVARGLSGVKYRVTDPIDIDVTLHLPMLWCVARYLAIERNYAGIQAIEMAYVNAITFARRANAKTNDRQWAGMWNTDPWMTRSLRYMKR